MRDPRKGVPLSGGGGMDRLSWQLPSVLRWVVGFLAGIFILCALAIAITRSAWPAELEWMEGGSLAQVQRLQTGQELYTAPTVEFTPFLYTPLYFEIAAWLPVNPSSPFLPMRVLSTVAWLISLGLIAQLVFRRTASGWWSVVGAGLYAACFELGGAWFDLARVDSLALMFLLAAWMALEPRSDGQATPWWSHLLGALFCLAAFLTKQSALVVLLPMVLYTLLFGRGLRRWLFPGLSLVGLSLLVVWLNHVSSGWFNYYVFELPAGHGIELSALAGFWRFDLVGPLPILALAVCFLAVQWLYARRDRELVWLLALALGFVGSAWLGRLHSGGYLNVLLPAFAFLAVWGVRSLHLLLEPAFDDPWTAFRVLPSEGSENLRHSLVLLACLLQLALLVYDPTDHIPRQADLQATRKLQSWIAAQPGEVWVPAHAWLASTAGKPTAAHEMALLDVLRGPQGDARRSLERALKRDLENGRWSAVILDRPWLEEFLQPGYRPGPPPYDTPDLGWPLTGMRTRPQEIWLRK
ncbi:MAG: hypothetical protein H6678_07330 [Candidatus Delongbacteria bacterium]|nr:hypothetical protein [Candidatus Delongbacteria bacterium]